MSSFSFLSVAVSLEAVCSFVVIYSDKTPGKRAEISIIAQKTLKLLNLPAMRGMRASEANPFDPSGPLGARIVVRRGADSSMELILMREIRRSGRGDESWILTTPQAEVFPVR